MSRRFYFLHFLGFVLLNVVPLLLAQSTHAQPASDAVAKAAVVAPFLDEQTLLVARIDLRQIDAAAVVATLGKLAPPTDLQFANELASLEQQTKQLLQSLAQLEVQELYVVVSLADLPKEPFFVVAPVKGRSDPQKAAAVLRQLLRFEETDTRPGLVIAGKKATIERLKALRPAPRPELARGFERAGDTTFQLVFCPSDDTRRVLREMLPRLPEEIGGGSGKMLADGMQWATISVQTPPRLSVSIVIRSRDAEAASALRGMIVSALQLLTRSPDVRKQWPQVDDFARLVLPRVTGEQLVLNISEPEQTEQVLRLLIAPLQATRTAAGRVQSMNNLKHIALAMHKFHDVHGRLPPQAIRGKDGKSLLSWRVAILPYLDAESLYREFHVDESWDSEHNKSLIAKMPTTLASPALGDERRTKGMTSYLVPLTHNPPGFAASETVDTKKPTASGKDQMVFDVVQGTKFQQIIDGTSNTIMVVEADPKSAVIWTKPDDLVMDLSNLLSDLRGQPSDGFSTVFCDGHAQFIKNSINPKTFLRLLQMNDRQPVGDY